MTIRALIELGKTGAQNVMYGVLATLVNVTNSYDKQEINPEMLELVLFARQHGYVEDGLWKRAAHLESQKL